MSDPLRVGLALGIGDVSWAVQKLRGLSEFHGGRPIEAHVTRSPNHSSVDFLKLCSPVASAVESELAPFDILNELKPSHRDSRWSMMAACRGWRGLDYVMVANGHLEMGERIEAYFPEVATEYRYELRLSAAAIESARAKIKPGSVLVYMSGIGPNAGFHADTWTARDWAAVVHLLNEAGVAPVLVGAPSYDDRSYAKRFAHVANGHRYENAVGLTSCEEIMAAILDCRAWIGLNSGLGIVAASQEVPTVMLWSDSEYPIDGVGAPLHHAMQRSWLPPGELPHYRTLSFGSPDLTPENVVKAALEVMR